MCFRFFLGNSVYQFLQKVLEVLRREFSELKTVMADQLMYVKEDLILPHHYTFYDFIVTKVINRHTVLIINTRKLNIIFKSIKFSY